MQHMWQKRTKRVLLLAVLPSILAFTLAATLIVVDGLNDDIHAADVAIVPGNTVEKDGRPSARLRARLDQTVALYRQGLFPNIIVSGGVGIEGFDEAEVMKRYLVERGVPEGRIHVDSGGGHDTPDGEECVPDDGRKRVAECDGRLAVFPCSAHEVSSAACGSRAGVFRARAILRAAGYIFNRAGGRRLRGISSSR